MIQAKRLLLTGLAALLLLLGVPGLGGAQLRWVVVNGVLQNPAQLAALDRHACAIVPNGSYWLDYNTGVWGYAGNPRPMGRVGDMCNAYPGSYSGPSRPSLSERGMLYSSGTWGRGR